MPANPAAIMNGKSGRQQLEAAKTLPIAVRLAATVPALLDDSVRVFDDIASLGMFSPDNATTVQKRARSVLPRRGLSAFATLISRFSSRTAWRTISCDGNPSLRPFTAYVRHIMP